MERYAHGAGVVTYLARYLRGGPLKNARLVAYDGDCVTFTSRARQGGGRRGARLSPTEDVARGGLSATVAPPCPGAPEARRAVLRAGSSYARRGLDHLPHGVGPTAAGGPTSPGLADRVCPTGRRASGTVSPPAGSGSCVPASSRVAVRHRLYGLGHSRHEADTRHAAGRSRSGGWCVWRWPGGVSPPAGQWSGELRGPSLRTTAPPGRRSGPVAGGMVWRCRGTNSIARRSPPCQAASVRGQSNQVLSEVLRAGRASTAGLSLLSTSDSILICYRQLGMADRQNQRELVASFHEGQHCSPWSSCRPRAVAECGAVRKICGTPKQRVR